MFGEGFFCVGWFCFKSVVEFFCGECMYAVDFVCECL